ncbi:MAG: hypothetical protein ACK45I_02865 [Bacteroidota bacterium]
MASILYQVKSLQKVIQKIDWFNILPNYSFFAPKPLLNDYRIAFKISTEVNEAWKEIPVYKKFNYIRIVWNPFKYYNKGLIDSCHFLIQDYHRFENKYFIQVSLYYLNILSLVSNFLNRTEGEGQKTIRFSILKSSGINNVCIDEVIFASFNQII